MSGQVTFNRQKATIRRGVRTDSVLRVALHHSSTIAALRLGAVFRILSVVLMNEPRSLTRTGATGFRNGFPTELEELNMQER